MRTIHALNLLLLTILVTVSVTVYPQLPERIPPVSYTHLTLPTNREV